MKKVSHFTIFLIKPGLRIEVSHQKGVTVVRYDLRDREE